MILCTQDSQDRRCAVLLHEFFCCTPKEYHSLLFRGYLVGCQLNALSRTIWTWSRNHLAGCRLRDCFGNHINQLKRNEEQLVQL